MIAIGGSIGTGLFIGSGQALAVGGPGSLLLAYVIVGIIMYFTVQALGEMAVTYPVAGSFSAFSTRFIDPAWGFAMGCYALNWLVVMPLEIIAAVSTFKFWNVTLSEPILVTLLLIAIVGINLCGVKTFGEAEFCFSALKVAAVIGFIILGVIINCAGGENEGYVGAKYWHDPGAFKSGLKGFASVLVTASFAFSGTELVGLAAAETHNPLKSIPTAVKQVFWRIFLFYVLSVFIVGLLVPSTHPNLANSSSNIRDSPFVIAVTDAGLQGLDSVMNAVVLISVLSVANSSLFGSSRTIAALAEQKQAPRIFNYVDRNGRPLVAVAFGAVFGLLAYLGTTSTGTDVFTWLLAISGLSSVFTWGTICLSHIRFRKAWVAQGYPLTGLMYRSPVGIVGSYIGFISLCLVLVAQFWVAIAPLDTIHNDTALERTATFFSAYLAAPIFIFSFIWFKLWYKTKWIDIKVMDLKSGKHDFANMKVHHDTKEERSNWPRWKKIYMMLC